MPSACHSHRISACTICARRCNCACSCIEQHGGQELEDVVLELKWTVYRNLEHFGCLKGVDTRFPASGFDHKSVDTGDKHKILNIYTNFMKIWNGPKRILRGPGGTDSWNKPEKLKISCQTLCNIERGDMFLSFCNLDLEEKEKNKLNSLNVNALSRTILEKREKTNYAGKTDSI
jgi:hypothetical protein